ncbi:MAG TPA: cupin domain-containing protein [Actinoplanes sp.]|jgi:mannose-6-phosphate isomerase-like protein (cupin superfamily)
MIDYDGRIFRSAATETADTGGAGPIGHYHQRGDEVWAEFSGGRVVRGGLAGRCDADGVLTLAYHQLLDDGEVVAGLCTSRPELLADGRVRLHEQWRRFDGSAGVSVIEETSGNPNGRMKMQLIEGAGEYTAPDPGEPNHWIEHLRATDLSVGTYSIPKGGLDDQRPHLEDEIYLVRSGRATLVTDSGSAKAGPGSVLFVPANEKHRWEDITEDLTLVVIVAPPYKSREAS